jgi:hypothetical protein
VSRENAVEVVTYPADAGPTRGRDDPTEPYGLIRLPNGLKTAHDAPFGKHAVQRAHDIVSTESILPWVECHIRDIFDRQIAAMVAPFEPVNFAAAKGTRPVVKQLHTPVRHKALRTR